MESSGGKVTRDIKNKKGGLESRGIRGRLGKAVQRIIRKTNMAMFFTRAQSYPGYFAIDGKP